MTNTILNIQLEDNRWAEAIADINQVAEKVKDAVFAYMAEHENLEILKSEKPVIANLCLSNDETVHQLNKEFRNMDKPTNVLSFANLDFDEFNAVNELYSEIELGDIIIAYETMQKEADLENITLYAHFCHLLTHGLLHILGFDHIEEDEARYMESFEVEILQSLNIDNPYKED